MKKKYIYVLRDLRDIIKQTIVCLIGMSWKEKREKGIENAFEEMMAENPLTPPVRELRPLCGTPVSASDARGHFCIT